VRVARHERSGAVIAPSSSMARSPLGNAFRALLAAIAIAVAPAASAFDLQAHRGGRGLMPENTLAAFENAIRLGVTTLELDVAITADGVPVISHEPYVLAALARDADGRWLQQDGPLIRSLTLEQLQRFDVGRLNPAHAYGRNFASQEPRDGERIPTLRSLFELVRRLGADRVQFDIETKVFPDRPGDTLPPEQFVPILLAAIAEAGVADRVMIQSFDWRTLKIVQRLAPKIRTVFLTVEGTSMNNVASPAWTAGMQRADFPSVADMVRAAGGAVWAPNQRNVDRAAVAHAHALGLLLIPWTVNDPDDMRRLIDWKVDGIITDYPDRLREVMRERGVELPRAPR
jgi:glycerophosphoryl diester phosphodiesterase